MATWPILYSGSIVLSASIRMGGLAWEMELVKGNASLCERWISQRQQLIYDLFQLLLF